MSRLNLKRLSKDFILNLIASFIVTGILQLVIYPRLALIMDSELYGVLLTVIGIANTFAATTGNSLNNTRLLLNNEYEERGNRGDFLPILYLTNAISAVILFVVLLKFKIDLTSKALLVFYMVANATKTYGTVAYRIKLNYTRILICNILVGLGDLLGLWILVFTKQANHLWPIGFLIGELAAIVFLCFSSNVYREPFKTTPMFKRTIGKNSMLMSTTLTANLLIYLDRLLLLPILGGSAVTTYTVASVFGKSLGILMIPMAGVLLSYFSQKDFVMKRRDFLIFYAANICIGLSFILASHYISYWFTGYFYPNNIDESKAYLDIANAAAIVIVLGNMTQPTLLRFAPSYWLLIIQAAYCALYLFGSILVVDYYGLNGFSYVALGAACLKVLLQFMIGNKYIKTPVQPETEV